ncbi:MAG TPA: O-antigen ligase family protein [Pilimelia sp.]|nr:O-antigen ligase family protein [Pilimelia sp.]
MPEIHGIPGEILLLIALEAGVLVGSAGRWRQVVVPVGLVAALTAVLAYSYAFPRAALWPDPSSARNHLLALVLNLALIAVVAVTRPSRLAVLKTLGVGGCAVAVYLSLMGTTVGGRLTAEDLNPNAIGHASALTTVILTGVFVATRRAVWLVLAGPPVLLLVATQSRGAMVVLGVGWGVLWLLGRAGPIRVAAVAFGTVGAVLLTQPLQAAMGMLLSRRDASHLDATIRLDLVRLGIELAMAHPLTGVGYRQFSVYSGEALGIPLNAHNEYVRIAAESGLVALALLLMICARVAVLRGDPTTDRPLTAALAACLTGLAFSNTMSDLRSTLTVWVLLGLAWVARSAVAPAGPGSALADPAAPAVPATRRALTSA